MKRALVLDAAAEKAERELAELEAATEPDADAIAKKKAAIAAVRGTLAETRRRIDEYEKRSADKKP